MVTRGCVEKAGAEMGCIEKSVGNLAASKICHCDTDLCNGVSEDDDDDDDDDDSASNIIRPTTFIVAFAAALHYTFYMA